MRLKFNLFPMCSRNLIYIGLCLLFFFLSPLPSLSPFLQIFLTTRAWAPSEPLRCPYEAETQEYTGLDYVYVSLVGHRFTLSYFRSRAHCERVHHYSRRSAGAPALVPP